MSVTRRFAALTAIAAATGAFGLATLSAAGTAAAASVDDVFIAALDKQGIEPPSAQDAIELAQEVCAVFDGGATLDATVAAVADYTGLSTGSSAYFVGASVGAYCPEHADVIGV